MATQGYRAGQRGADGFTLMEMLVVMAVLAVLLGLTVPGVREWRQRQQLQALAEDFWSSLMLARAQALVHQQHVTVCSANASGACDVTSGWHAGWLVFVDGNRNGLKDPDEEVLQQRGSAPAGFQMLGNSTVRRVIGYGVEGRSEGLSGGFQAGTVSTCVSGQTQGWRVVINALGRPRLETAEVSSCP